MNQVVYQLVSFLIKLTCDAFCNLCHHFYHYIHLLVLDRESVQIFLSLRQNCLNTNCLRFVVYLVCGNQMHLLLMNTFSFLLRAKLLIMFRFIHCW